MMMPAGETTKNTIHSPYCISVTNLHFFITHSLFILHFKQFKYIIMSVVRLVKLRVLSGNAKPGPAIGQALGPLGINMAEFCKQFNEASGEYEPNIPLSVVLTALSDRSFTFQIKSPPTTFLLKRAVGMAKGPSLNSPEVVTAYITPETVYEIAKIKHKEQWHLPLEGVARSVIGTARTLGIVCAEHEDKEETTPEEEEEEEAVQA
jgi:large subunit ribosomal protein L11